MADQEAPVSITQTWLAQGHHFDDVALWDRLCHWLDLQTGKCAYLRAIPSGWAPLLYDSQGARRLREAWDRYELSPVFFVRERGWCLHTDWFKRLELLRSKDPLSIADHLSSTVTRREAKFLRRMTTGAEEVFVCEICKARDTTARTVSHQPSYLIMELHARITALRAGHIPL
jgi:hypothetical protein